MTPLSPMFKEVFSQIFKKPATQRYPEEMPKIPEGFRGKIIFNVNLCVGCGLCSRDCPANAIEMIRVNEGRKPLFHLDSCIFCHQCVESCPRGAIKSSKIFELASTNKSDLIIKPK